MYIHIFRVTDNEAYLLYEYLFVCCICAGLLCTCWCIVNMLVCCVHAQVEEFQSVRERLSAQMAEDASFIRSWIIRAEDARLMENWYNHALNTFLIVRFRDASSVISLFVGAYPLPFPNYWVPEIQIPWSD